VKGKAGTVPPAAGTAGPATAGGAAAGDWYAAGCGTPTAGTAGTTASTVSVRSGGTYVVFNSYRVLSANGLSCRAHRARHGCSHDRTSSKRPPT